MHYKAPDNSIHFIDPAFAELLPAGSVPITDAEAAQLQKFTIDKAKEVKWEAIKAERERRKAGGAHVSGKWFHTDTESRIQHIGLTMLGSNIPPGLQWKTMDGTFVTMTQSLANQIFGAVMALDMQAHAVAENHRIAMEASADPQNYDYAAGWPAIFSA